MGDLKEQGWLVLKAPNGFVPFGDVFRESICAERKHNNIAAQTRPFQVSRAIALQVVPHELGRDIAAALP